MKKETKFKQVQNLIFAGLKNLFNSQDELDFDKFTFRHSNPYKSYFSFKDGEVDKEKNKII